MTALTAEALLAARIENPPGKLFVAPDLELRAKRILGSPVTSEEFDDVPISALPEGIMEVDPEMRAGTWELR